MKTSTVLLWSCTLAAVLCVVVSAEEPRLECTEVSLPAYLKSVAARNAVSDIVTKVLRCLEKTAQSATKTVMTIIKDVTGCVARFPVDFFKCLAKADVPNKVAEIINVGMETIKCLS